MDFNLHFEPSLLLKIIPFAVVVLVILIAIYFISNNVMENNKNPRFNKKATIAIYAFIYIIFMGIIVFAYMGATPYAIICAGIFLIGILGALLVSVVSKKIALSKIAKGEGLQITGQVAFCQKISSTQVNHVTVKENFAIHFEYIDEETGAKKYAMTAEKLSYNDVVYYNALKTMPIVVYKKYCKILETVPKGYRPSREDLELYKHRNDDK